MKSRQQDHKACLRRLGKKDGWYGNQPYGYDDIFRVCKSSQRLISAGEAGRQRPAGVSSHQAPEES